MKTSCLFFFHFPDARENVAQLWWWFCPEKFYARTRYYYTRLRCIYLPACIIIRCFCIEGLYTGQREKNDNFSVVIIYRKKQIPNTCSSRPNGNFEQTSSPIYYYDDNRNGYNGELWRLEPVSGLFSFGNQFYNTKITETSI